MMKTHVGGLPDAFLVLRIRTLEEDLLSLIALCERIMAKTVTEGQQNDEYKGQT
jgi:hypothetical protein